MYKFPAGGWHGVRARNINAWAGVDVQSDVQKKLLLLRRTLFPSFDTAR